MKEAIGRWRITSMEVWDNDFLDAEVQAHITIHKNMKGDFQFGYVQGEIDGRVKREDGALILDFSWAGCFHFHMGDESDFTVTRENLSTS